MRRVIAVLATLATCLAAGAEAQAAATLAVDVRPPTPGTIAAPNPVAVGVRATFAADAPGAQPASVRMLAIATPDGFAKALAGTTACPQAQLEAGGSAACPASSKLGSGSADFVYVIGGFQIPVSTAEVGLFRGDGDAILLYARVAQPAPFTIVLPGALTARAAPLGPVLTLDLSRVANAAGASAGLASGTVIPTRASFDLERGLAAGPCVGGRWTFTSRLVYADGRTEDRSPEAPCAADTTRPTLRATASNGTPQRGARFRVRLSEAATVAITLDRRVRGRWARVRKVSFRAPAGSSNLAIRRANGRALPAGSYRARLRAVDGAGLASSTRTVTFRLRARG